ncbi:polya polymerase [Anaerotalea alkaliphila]|uniref:Polya polymerase n=1 Tax=Anaerotalea alkaliphila TaxID=2662126 RepID=A0A7X5HX08_9FIRM|nr:polya polymerase [Anaerotalea alkaliphila]NDL68168.1 polya polymerase [Anaerotalea alkaliphila]
MKIKNIKNIERFFEVVDQCKGRVELKTSEGDIINLKSKLSQYFSLAMIFSDGNIPEIDITASEPEDMEKLLQYLIRG